MTLPISSAFSGPDRLEPGGARIAVEHRADVDQVDRLVVDLAFAELHQALDEAAETETLGIDGSHGCSPWIATRVAGL